MPELPEVEALARWLDRELAGDVVARIDVTSINALKTYDPPPTALQGLAITGVGRRGKHLDITVDEFHIVVHLARAGWIRMKAFDAAKPTPRGKRAPAVRIVLASDQAVDITDAATQKKVAVSIVRDPLDVASVARLGPDPLNPAFDRTALDAILDEAGRAQLKGVLRDQSVIAGIGNAYSDEILHAARLSPFAPAAALDDAQREALFSALTGTLSQALERALEIPDGSGLKDGKRAGMSVHGRTGEQCPVCGDVVREVSFSDSSLQYCATCQTGGKPLKDRSTSKFLK
jgi:formamidopyrimidine-DNA glycosylase